MVRAALFAGFVALGGQALGASITIDYSVTLAYANLVDDISTSEPDRDAAGNVIFLGEKYDIEQFTFPLATVSEGDIVTVNIDFGGRALRLTDNGSPTVETIQPDIHRTGEPRILFYTTDQTFSFTGLVGVAGANIARSGTQCCAGLGFFYAVDFIPTGESIEFTGVQYTMNVHDFSGRFEAGPTSATFDGPFFHIAANRIDIIEDGEIVARPPGSVPEPGTAALLLLGLAATAGISVVRAHRARRGGAPRGGGSNTASSPARRPQP